MLNKCSFPLFSLLSQRIKCYVAMFPVSETLLTAHVIAMNFPFPSPLKLGRVMWLPSSKEMWVEFICATSWIKHLGAGARRSNIPFPCGNNLEATRSKQLVFLSHQLEDSPGKLPNLLWNLQEWQGNHCCAKPLNFWGGLLSHTA